MRIALLSSDPAAVFGDGHACPVRLRGLALAFARAGHETSVIVAGHEVGAAEAAPGLSVRPLRTPVSVREIDWHLSRLQPDLVVEHHVTGCMEGAIAASEAGVPHLYDLELTSRTQALGGSLSVRGALPEALALSRGTVVTSERAAAWVRGLMGAGHPVTVVPGAAGAEFLASPAHDTVMRVEQMLRLPLHKHRIAFYGPLLRDGGLVALVRGLGQLPAERRPRLVVIGEGPERNAALAAAEDAQVGLVLCGAVTHHDAPAYLALCGVAVVPGLADDGVPQALLEAMAMERAVIAPDGEALRSVVRHGHDAHLVDFDDPAALAGAVEALLADTPRRERLGASARGIVAARHTWDGRAEQVLRFADRVVFAPGAAAEAWQPATRSAGAQH